ncbi:CHY zinc finger domain-containing protein [Diaporthe helianthi]|uniref:CHY zinc finger domain-containing protein n=1 Tax=Diaporthe helianthi TaxID=158607 RepID=A0A2P5HRF4_DIAHE|nr:CHY zinc finger domain-containing protein [Diaporthe helianthi]
MISTSNHQGASDRQATRAADSARIVPKPVPKAQSEDPRTYQIKQLRKRYSPKESTVENGAATSLLFDLLPSDPDFPFELDHLKCQLRIPKNYPKDSSPPTLAILNKDIPRGFAINVEKGWEELVQERAGSTLLALVNALDRNLEEFLSRKQVDTVKLTMFKDTRHLEGKGIDAQELSPEKTPAQVSETTGTQVSHTPYIPEETFTKDQKAESKARRAQETRQIETRMSRLPHYKRSSDGIVYTLPLEPKRRHELPVGLRGVNLFQLIVPVLYPLQPLRILLNDVESEDAEDVEELFAEKAKDKTEMTLMSHMNYLTQNFHVLVKQALKRKKDATPAPHVSEQTSADATVQEPTKPSAVLESKGNVQVIPRPPEWDYQAEGKGADEDSDESTSSEDEDGGVALTAQPGVSGVATQTIERGTSISFPSIDLLGIELFQISILALSVKCQRCRTVCEIGGLKPNTPKTAESCRKCGTSFSLTFRPELVHAYSSRAGFIDATGCTVADMLPSTFVPTCAKCSTPTTQGLVAVRGDTMTNVCRECHARFTFKIPEVKFLVYSAGTSALAPTSGPRRRDEKLGLHAGEPLPDKGVCKHYRKSYRWFRFSCCQKVHSCDRCHDDAEDHPNEWANRMICGHCSREQTYKPGNCTFCGRNLVSKVGTGFWEGGKGTRDRVFMSRKDPRKKRRPHVKKD